MGREDKKGSSIPGEDLGPVGGTLVAEVIIGLMELDSDSFLCTDRDWLPTLGSNGTFLMKDLIAKAATAM